jgi:threonine-phosphate decarboxylase
VQQYPWSVNAFSQVAGLAALKDRQYVHRSLSFMERMRSRLIQDLGTIEGLTAFPSLANFLLIELPSGRYAPALAAALRKQGILIRDCSTIPGLGRRTIRVAIRSMMENRRLVAALRRHLSGHAS